METLLLVFNLSTIEMVARVAETECGITFVSEVVPTQPVLFAFFFVGHRRTAQTCSPTFTCTLYVNVSKF